MRSTLALMLLLASVRVLAAAPPVELTQQLVDLEKQSWVAWQGHGAKFFQDFLSDDHVEVGFGGPAGKKPVVDMVGNEKLCTVESYAVDRFSATRVADDVVLLVYHAAQKTTCGGKPVPSPVWASSLYVKRDGRWQNVMYQHSAAID
jgi:hypothetical protein